MLTFAGVAFGALTTKCQVCSPATPGSDLGGGSHSSLQLSHRWDRIGGVLGRPGGDEVIGVGSNSRDFGFYEKRQRYTERMLCYDRGRDGSDVAISQVVISTTRCNQSSRGAWTNQHLDFGLLASRL